MARVVLSSAGETEGDDESAGLSGHLLCGTGQAPCMFLVSGPQTSGFRLQFLFVKGLEFQGQNLGFGTVGFCFFEVQDVTFAIATY